MSEDFAKGKEKPAGLVVLRVVFRMGKRNEESTDSDNRQRFCAAV